MRVRGILPIVAAAVLAGGGASPAAPPPASAEEIRGWIEKLGAPEFAVREEASRALEEIGEGAAPALEAAAASEDPEIQTRAQRLLRNLREGIRPDTPPAIAALMRRYPALPRQGKQEALASIASALRIDAIPFFVRRAAAAEEWEGRAIAEQIERLRDTNAWRRVIQLLGAPQGAAQAALLAQACRTAGSLEETAAALACESLLPQDRAVLAEAALQRLDPQSVEPKKLAELATALGRSGADARFLYLEASALQKLNRGEEAAQRIARAQAMSPEEEAPHYTAAELLEKLEQPELAIQEWERILAIPPQGDVYDINAWMRLGSLLAEADKPDEAADAYEKGLAAYRKATARRGHGMGMIGASEDELERRIQSLRERGRQDGDPRFALEIELESSLKQGKPEDLELARAQRDGSLEVNVQPEGLRLFEEVAAAQLVYDAKSGTANVLLNGSACGKAAPLRVDKPSAFVELRSLDYLYFFEINMETGEARLDCKFELDYVLKVKAPAGFDDWSDVQLRVGDKTCDWAEAGKGIPLDYLPKKLELEISGTAPDGKRQKLTYTIAPGEHRKAERQTRQPEPAPGKEDGQKPQQDGDEPPENRRERMVVDPSRVVQAPRQAAADRMWTA